MKRLDKRNDNQNDPNFRDITLNNLVQHLQELNPLDVKAGGSLLNWLGANEIHDPEFKDPFLASDDPACAHSEIEHIGACVAGRIYAEDEYPDMLRDYVRGLMLARTFAEEHEAYDAAGELQRIAQAVSDSFMQQAVSIAEATERGTVDTADRARRAIQNAVIALRDALQGRGVKQPVHGQV